MLTVWGEVMNCPDCGQSWGRGPQCQHCQLDQEDLEAAAAFTLLDEQELRYVAIVGTSPSRAIIDAVKADIRKGKR